MHLTGKARGFGRQLAVAAPAAGRAAAAAAPADVQPEDGGG